MGIIAPVPAAKKLPDSSDMNSLSLGEIISNGVGPHVGLDFNLGSQ